MQLFENPAREAHIRQALNCSLEHTVIAAVNEYLRWYEKREAALSQAKEAQWVEELAKTQSQRPSLPANATPVAASPLVPAQPRPISQPVLLPQTQTNPPLNPATSSSSLLSMPGAIEPQPRTLSYASDASMYPSSSLLLQQSLPQPQPPAYQPPPLPDIIQQSPELRNLCTIDRFEPARVLSAINELGTTDVSKVSSSPFERLNDWLNERLIDWLAGWLVCTRTDQAARTRLDSIRIDGLPSVVGAGHHLSTSISWLCATHTLFAVRLMFRLPLEDPPRHRSPHRMPRGGTAANIQRVLGGRDL